jgi:NitT/TauT family transport system permease protein
MSAHDFDHDPDVYAAFDPDVPASGMVGTAVRRYLPALAIFLTGIALWEGAVQLFDIERFVLPAPSDIGGKFVDEFETIWRAGFFTFREALGGFVIGGSAGVLAALATARWPAVKEGAMPFAIAANSTPIIALAPIMNIWFGITDPLAKMAVVAVIVFFPVLINTARGLTEVGTGELELMRSYAASKGQTALWVRLPNALPYLFSALKVASALSVIGAIVAEYFGGPRNALGVYISQQAALFHFSEAWAAIVVGTILGVAFYLTVLVAERLIMPWHVSLRRAET